MTGNRALKEWAVACDAVKSGKQTVLIRKGGIREDDGVFTVTDSEFFLLPTYEHQNPALLQERYRSELNYQPPPTPGSVTIDTFCIVDSVMKVSQEENLPNIDFAHIWNDRYVRMRLEFNPYDPLYVILLRAFRMVDPIEIPLLPEYEGCRSWVTLDCMLSASGARPALNNEQFALARARVLAAGI